MADELLILDIDEVIEKGVFFAPLVLRFKESQILPLVYESREWPSIAKWKTKGGTFVWMRRSEHQQFAKVQLQFGFMPLMPLSAEASELFESLGELRSLRSASLLATQYGWPFQVPKFSSDLVYTGFYVLCGDPVLGAQIKLCLEKQRALVIESFGIAELAMSIMALIHPHQIKEMCEACLLGLAAPLGKASLPLDILQKKATEVLTDEEEVILKSHTQNLSLLVERDKRISDKGFKFFHDMDKIIRQEEHLPFLGNEVTWSVVLAVEIFEALKKSQPFQNAAEAAQWMEQLLKRLSLPEQIKKNLNSHYVKYSKGWAA